MSQLAARNRLWFVVIAILSFAGMIVSAVSLQRHYAKSASEFCDFSQKFNCDIVNRSEYSEVQGIPVAAIGVLGYATLFFLSTFWNSRATTPNRRNPDAYAARRPRLQRDSFSTQDRLPDASRAAANH